MHRVGSVFLEKLLSRDPGHRGHRIDCGHGHHATFVGYREKHLTTVLGPLRLRRAYYECPPCGRGVVPRDEELDVVGSSLSPGVRRMAARTGSQEPFARASRDLEELAGISIPAKQVERVAESSGERLGVEVEAQWEAILDRRVIPLPAPAPIPTLYIAVDGTGVPTVPRETAGRRGKGPDGRAHTREVKLGCLFTQAGLDDRGRPQRDPHSSSYVAAVESAAKFGQILYAEAVRRGISQAQQVVVIGDGAHWIWNVADEHFPKAIQIVDLFHAREKLGLVAKLLFPSAERDRRAWLLARTAELDRGDVATVLRKLGALACHGDVAEEVRKVTGYFKANRQRMRYGQYRRLGLFVGSGVVEAGCKSVVHQRLKQSGMRWSLRGAESIIWLRCLDQSGRWEELWTELKTG
ncbi:MAG: hypothetical protein NVSMB4_15460 [Acidimicrobiales bacterium]